MELNKTGGCPVSGIPVIRLLSFSDVRKYIAFFVVLQK